MQPIFQELYENEAFARLMTGIRNALEIKDPEQRRSALISRRTKVQERLAALLTQQLELAGILGPNDPLPHQLADVSNVLKEFDAAVGRWLEGSAKDDEMRSASDSLGRRYGEGIGKFTRAAYDRVGWEPRKA